MTYTRQQKHEAAAREVKQRKRVYVRLVADGRMTQAFADEQIAVMQAIADDYAEPDMFGLTAPTLDIQEGNDE